MKPLVSIVIPTFNRAADLRRAMASVLAQSWTRWEAIIVDNQSTDSTPKVVEDIGDPRVRIITVKNDGVIALSRNVGMANAAGEFVAFLDSDDWWAPRKLEMSVGALRRGADVIYHDLYYARSTVLRRRWGRARTRDLPIPAYEDLIANGNALTTSSVVVRREIMAGIGGFSEDRSFIGWEDFDAWLRIARITEDLERLREPLGYYWVGGGNVSSPQRTIDNLETFREIYIATEPRRRDRALPAWYHYGLGRAYYHLGSYATALDHMRHALRNGLPAAKSIKAFLTAAESWTRVLVGTTNAQAR